MNATSGLKTAVFERMGVLPSFFSDGPSPVVTAELWKFACSAYLDNPLPSNFKERLFVYLSRFCTARYCLIRHVGFLIGKGHVAGDAEVPAHAIDEVIALFDIPSDPADDEVEAATARLRSVPAGEVGMAAGLESERDLFIICGKLFHDPHDSRDIRLALRHALGDDGSELLLAFLAFVRTAQYWTVLHPEIQVEPDMDQVMEDNPELAALMLGAADGDGTGAEAARRLAAEFSQLVDLRDERDQLREAIAERERARDKLVVLNRELNHRVKNLFALIRSMVKQSARGEHDGRIDAEKLVSRIDALGLSHAITVEPEDLQPVPLARLVETVLSPHSRPDYSIEISGSDVKVARSALTPVGMILHELATNAAKYGGLSPDADASGGVSVTWAEDCKGVRLDWVEARGGQPLIDVDKAGFGRRLKDACAAQLGGSLERMIDENEFRVSFFVPTVGDEIREPSGLSAVGEMQ